MYHRLAWLWAHRCFFMIHAFACVQLRDSWGLIEIEKFLGTCARRPLRLMVHGIAGYQCHTFSEV